MRIVHWENPSAPLIRLHQIRRCPKFIKNSLADFCRFMHPIRFWPRQRRKAKAGPSDICAVQRNRWVARCNGNIALEKVLWKRRDITWHNNFRHCRCNWFQNGHVKDLSRFAILPILVYLDRYCFKLLVGVAIPCRTFTTKMCNDYASLFWEHWVGFPHVNLQK